MENSKSCTSCFFSEQFPGITIQENGKCNLCNQQGTAEDQKHKAIYDISELHQIAEELKAQKSKYDCVIGASGGLDSSHVIYVAKKVLNLNPLVIHYDHGFSYELANQNLEAICKALNVELRTIRSQQQNDRKYVKYMVKALSPLGVYWGVCFFCHYVLSAVVYKNALQEQTPAILTSSNDYEANLYIPQRYKMNFILRSLAKNGILQLLKTIFYLAIANYYLLRLKLEFYLPPVKNLFSRSPMPTQIRLVNITPYLGLELDKMVTTLKDETGWQPPPSPKLPMRFDCKIEDSLINLTYQNASGITVHGIICNNLIHNCIRTKDDLRLSASYYQEIIEPRKKEVFDILGIKHRN